jgi:hypothetical protein
MGNLLSNKIVKTDEYSLYMIRHNIVNSYPEVSKEVAAYFNPDDLGSLHVSITHKHTYKTGDTSSSGSETTGRTVSVSNYTDILAWIDKVSRLPNDTINKTEVLQALGELKVMNKTLPLKYRNYTDDSYMQFFKR